MNKPDKPIAEPAVGNLGSADSRITLTVNPLSGDTAAPHDTPPPTAEPPAEPDAPAAPPATSRLAASAPYLLVYGEADFINQQDPPHRFHWSVVWADLMMTMFILFATMYMFQGAHRNMFDSGDQASGGAGGGAGQSSSSGASSGRQAESGSAGPGEAGQTGAGVMGQADSGGDLGDLVTNALNAADMKDFASIDLASDRAIRIVLTGDLLFDPARAELKQKSVDSLRKIGEIIKKTPHAINVAGHTDSIPIHNAQFATNWELSVMRATKVARFLIEEMRIPARQVSVSGFADYKPVETNKTASGRAANRRVEIIISRDAPEGGLPADYRKLLETNGGGG